MKATPSKTLAILGGNGMLGRDLVTFFGKKTFAKEYKVTSITRQNYAKHIGESFDIFINANGNSKRWWANQNPVDDFQVSTLSVIRSLFDFSAKTYVYISSVDVYLHHDKPKYTSETSNIDPKKLEPYGLHKFLAEQLVKKYMNQYLILRPSAILGTSLNKGPIYDAVNDKPLFITPTSKLQFITSSEIGVIIDKLIKMGLQKEIFNVGGIGAYSLSKLNKLLKKKIQVSPEARTQVYEMSIQKLKRFYPNLKSSEEYLQDYCGNI